MSETVVEGQTTEPEKVQTNAQDEIKEPIQKSQAELIKSLREVRESEKQTRLKNLELKRQLEEKEKAKLQDQGQFKELAEIWQRKATESEAQANKLKQAFAIKTVADTLSLEAQKMGCIDTDALVNLIQLDQVPIDETFNVDRENVKAMLEDFRKTKPYFFQKQAPKIADATPAQPQAPVGKDLSKMTLAERAALLSQLKNQGK